MFGTSGVTKTCNELLSETIGVPYEFKDEGPGDLCFIHRP